MKKQDISKTSMYQYANLMPPPSLEGLLAATGLCFAAAAPAAPSTGSVTGQQDVLWSTSADESSVFEGKLMHI